MRLNGHNDQCACAECGAPTNQMAMPIGGTAVQINDSPPTDATSELGRAFPPTPLTDGERAGPPTDPRPPRERHGLPDNVPVRPRHYDAEDRSMAEVYGEAEIVGTVELAEVPAHGLVVALEVRLRGGERWAIWWDRTGDKGRMVARPIASTQ